MRYRPILWRDMPMSIKKCYLRTERAYPIDRFGDGRIGGWYWLIARECLHKCFAQARDGRWYAADIQPMT